MKRVLTRFARATPDEVLVRCRESIHETAEAIQFRTGAARWNRATLRSRLLPDSAHVAAAATAIGRGDMEAGARSLRAHFLERPSSLPVDPAEWVSVSAAILERIPSAVSEAVASAERIIQGRYDLLGYRELDFRTDGRTIDWHWDPVHQRRAPLRFWASVPYLNPAIGDHKVIWELNRHQHWLKLGRAAWLTREPRYSAAIVGQLHAWMAANPPLAGINWASMLELGLRSISWIWALHLLLPFDDDRPEWILDLLLGLDRQLDHVARHLSLYFSPNTHLLGEALALYVAGRSLPELASASRWEAVGRRILLREIAGQVNTDGGHAELSTHYHRYALDFYLLALVVARRTGDSAAGPFAEVALRMAAYCRAIANDRGHLPTIGDDDGGQLFPICDRAAADAASSLAVAAALLDRPDLAVSGPCEEAIWFCGQSVAPATSTRTSTLFPDTGYAVLRRGGGQAILDAGPHGFMNGGHAHADALSLVLSVGDRPVLIDPGTATYTTDPERRDRFRSTAMHNTVAIDGTAQATPSGPFHWATRVDARVDVWRTSGTADFVEASHDAYGPVVHRRAILAVGDGLWLVADHVLGGGAHQADAYWHLDPAWTLARPPAGSALLSHPDGLAAALASTAAECHWFHGDADGLGWCAPVYGQLQRAVTLRFRDRREAPFSILTGIATARTLVHLAIEHREVRADRQDGWHRVAAAGVHGDAPILALFATPLGAGGRRGVQRITWRDGELSTDAQAALFRLTPLGDPDALTLIDGRVASWTGPGAFAVDSPAAADLHLDRTALAARTTLDARCG